MVTCDSTIKIEVNEQNILRRFKRSGTSHDAVV